MRTSWPPGMRLHPTIVCVKYQIVLRLRQLPTSSGRAAARRCRRRLAGRRPRWKRPTRPPDQAGRDGTDVGPFNGRQLTTIIVTLVIGVVAAPTAIWAADTLSNVAIKDPASGRPDQAGRASSISSAVRRPRRRRTAGAARSWATCIRSSWRGADGCVLPRHRPSSGRLPARRSVCSTTSKARRTSSMRRATTAAESGHVVLAIWMRLPQVSSKTAVVTGPISRGCWVNRTPSP